MKRTEYGHEIKPENNEAVPYYRENGTWNQIEPLTDMQNTMGAGSLVSTPTEVTLFYNALFTGKLVSEKSLQKMTDVSTGMGYGMDSGVFNERKGFGHDGSIDGFQSFALYMPSEKVAIAISSNAYNIPFSMFCKVWFRFTLANPMKCLNLNRLSPF